MFETTTIVVLVTACFVTSTISAILGMAGGVTLLGVMTALLPAPVVVPLHGIVQLASNWTRTWAFRRYVRWSIFFAFMVPAVAGVAIAASVWSDLELTWFRAWIGAFILLFLVWRRYKPKLRNPPVWSYAVLGLVAGLLAIFVGATGPFLAPFFLRDDFDNSGLPNVAPLVEDPGVLGAELQLWALRAGARGLGRGRHRRDVLR